MKDYTDQWLTIESNKKDGKFKRFTHQGYKNKVAKEKLLELINNWNNNPNNTTTWKLVEDESIEQLAGDILKSYTIQEILDDLEGLKRECEEFSSRVDYTIEKVEESLEEPEEEE